MNESMKYETSKDIEAREQAEQAAKMKKRSIINTIIVLIIVAGLAAFVYTKKDSLIPKSTKTETKEEEKVEEPKEEEPEVELSFQSLEKKRPYSIEITLNGNKHTLSASQKGALITVKLDDRILEEEDDDGYGLKGYMIIKGADGKEYFILRHWLFADYYYFYNEEGKLLKILTNRIQELECEAVPGKIGQEELPNFTATNKVIHIYKYHPNTFQNEGTPIKVDEYDIEVKNDLVIESPTGKVLEGYVSNCE